MGQITPGAQEMLHPNMNDNQKDEYYAGDLILADDMNKDMNSIVHDLQKLYYLTTASADEDAPTGYDNTFIQYHRLNLENKIIDKDIADGAAIAYAKLSLGNSIKNDDVANDAGIVYSKLSLANSIVDNDIAIGAAIKKSKINFKNSTNNDGTIIDEDVASTAAIKKSKINFRNDTDTDGTIVNRDVASTAAIKKSKINFRNDTDTDGTIVDNDVASTAKIKKSKINFKNDTNTDGTIIDEDISIDAAIQKSKIALTGTITKDDFNGNSFTGDGRIPLKWIAGEVPTPYLPIDVSEGVLGGDSSTNLYQHVFANNKRNKLLYSDDNGKVAVLDHTTTANSDIQIPAWNTYGLITGAKETVYKKSCNINGTQHTFITTSNNSLPNNMRVPTSLGTTGQLLTINNGDFSWMSPASKTLTINKTSYNFNVSTSNVSASVYAPESAPTPDTYTDYYIGWDTTNKKAVWARFGTSKYIKLNGLTIQSGATTVATTEFYAPIDIPNDPYQTRGFVYSSGKSGGAPYNLKYCDFKLEKTSGSFEFKNVTPDTGYLATALMNAVVCHCFAPLVNIRLSGGSSLNKNALLYHWFYDPTTRVVTLYIKPPTETTDLTFYYEFYYTKITDL